MRAESKGEQLNAEFNPNQYGTDFSGILKILFYYIGSGKEMRTDLTSQSSIHQNLFIWESQKMTLFIHTSPYSSLNYLSCHFSYIMLVIPCSNLPVAMFWKVSTVISPPIRKGVFLPLNIAYHFSKSLLHNLLRCLQKPHMLPMSILDS